MMKKIIIAFILMIPSWSFAQESALNTFYEKYSGKEGYVSVYITEFTFQLFKQVENAQEGKDFDETVTKLKGIKMLTPDSVNRSTFLDDLRAALPKNQYKDMMVVRDGSSTIRFMLKEEGSKITEFIMTIEGEDSPFLLFLEGDIDLNEVAKLARTMDINGFEHLEKVKDN